MLKQLVEPALDNNNIIDFLANNNNSILSNNRLQDKAEIVAQKKLK